ncbi:MAG: UvrD-helicase domain-containing protein [Chthoniobacterales bacterium]
MSEPADTNDRRRFAEELDRNFSVVAAAGSGKTYAITERIVRIACSSRALEILPKLVVVTFTHRAADEMQQRTRQRILDSYCPPDVQAALNRAFFGTIHSFCMKLLGNYGHYVGMPAALDLVTDDTELWEEFVQQHTRIGRGLSAENRAALFRLASARQLMELARNAPSALAPADGMGPCPKVDFADVYSAVGRSQSEDTIANSKAELKDWERRYAADWEFVRWPVRSSEAKEFAQKWRDAFQPLRTWVTDAALCVAAEVQRDYRDFRLERGVVTYADQVALADELMRHPAAARRIREENFRVILDEAQDTDPVQFSVLTEIARPPGAKGPWLETKADPPRAGHFCMVGDFQQSIYRDRADLDRYRAIHCALVGDASADELKFSVTFRLDQRQVDFVNATFREILNNKHGQVEFVELQPRPDALPGQVVQVPFHATLLPKGKKQKDYQKAQIEAKALANWIKTTGLEKLRANSWRDVAILCPRKLWLRTMATALRHAGVPATIQSESDLKGDNPAYAWLTALCTIMADPRNAYEVVGVLREVFGIADSDLAEFSAGNRTRFHIDQPISAVGVVSSPLRLLAETRTKIQGRPLFDAISILIEQTHLRERLAALPTEDFPRLGHNLDALFAQVAEAEANGATLRDFAANLRADFLGQRETQLIAGDGIQLITAYKAKGSEWQAVILPFLGRGIMYPSPRYPCVLKVPGTNEPLIALTKDDYGEDVRGINKAAVRQEMARLLYVAATRARHTLVLAYDRELFLNSRNALPSTAQLSHFGNEATHAAAFKKISDSADLCLKTAEADAHAREQRAGLAMAIPPLGKTERRHALERADKFVRKVNPSAYEPDAQSVDIDAATPARFRSRADNVATLYGRWWHQLVEHLPWESEPASWNEIFERELGHSPDAARSRREWRRLLEHLSGASDFRRRIDSGSPVAHPEMPFFWSVDKRTCLEGFVDLALFDPDAGKCLIIDWKTNRASEAEVESLRERYRPQLSAYWRAITATTRLTVEAGLYATATGSFLLYDTGELEEEWRRLRTLPTDELQAEIALDTS